MSSFATSPSCCPEISLHVRLTSFSNVNVANEENGESESDLKIMGYGKCLIYAGLAYFNARRRGRFGSLRSWSSFLGPRSPHLTEKQNKFTSTLFFKILIKQRIHSPNYETTWVDSEVLRILCTVWIHNDRNNYRRFIVPETFAKTSRTCRSFVTFLRVTGPWGFETIRKALKV